MRFKVLLSRIDERLLKLGLSERKACITAKVGVNSIRHLRPPREHAPKAETLRKLEKMLGVTSGYFLDAAAVAELSTGQMVLEQVFVKAAVQAGVWQEAVEWDADQWFPVTVPASTKYPGLSHFGLLVRGNSMDRLYPDGTIIIAVRFGDLGRDPKSGERVVVLRRSHRTGEFEATLKEFEIDLLGRRILWPRSTDPTFQTPFIMSPEGAEIVAFPEMPGEVLAGEALFHDAGEADVQITALVIGSYRPE